MEKKKIFGHCDFVKGNLLLLPNLKSRKQLVELQKSVLLVFSCTQKNNVIKNENEFGMMKSMSNRDLNFFKKLMNLNTI